MASNSGSERVPTLEEMIDEFYSYLPWPRRDQPTPDIPETEIALLKELVLEENDEFTAAIDRRDIQLIADAVADIIYVAYSAARHFGFDPAKVAYAVHKANMSKLGPDGKFELDERGKVKRGPNYRAPDIWGALYRR